MKLKILFSTVVISMLLISLCGCQANNSDKNNLEHEKKVLTKVATKYLPEVQKNGYLTSATKAEIQQEVFDKTSDDDAYIDGSKKFANEDQVYIKIKADCGVLETSTTVVAQNLSLSKSKAGK